jgi:hypothetical protein
MTSGLQASQGFDMSSSSVTPNGSHRFPVGCSGLFFGRNFARLFWSASGIEVTYAHVLGRDIG